MGNPKDEFDYCTKLAELGFDHYNARRENQWKVALAIWGLIIVTTKYVLTDPIAEGTQSPSAFALDC
jgi:hypothetical protein